MPNIIKHFYHYIKAFIYIMSLPKVISKKKVVLIINHFYDQDVEALVNANKKNSNIYLVIIQPRKAFAPVMSLFPLSLRGAKIPYGHNSVKREQKIAYKLSQIIFKLLFRKIPFDLVLTPSDQFYWEREFINVVKKNSIPVVVLDKEGTISPYYFVHHINDIKELYPPISDKYLVWSESQREFWLNCGVSKGKIKVIGQPRSDLLISLKPYKLNLFKNQDNPLILFYTYELDAYIPSHLYKDKSVSWLELRTQSHEQIKKLASKHKDINYIVKCHPQQLDIQEIKDEFKKFDNIKVLTGSTTSNQLLINADLVIGFQTTALIESIVLNKPTIYTFFTKDIELFKDGILPFHEYDVFNIVYSDTELHDEVERFITNNFTSKTQMESRNKLINKYLNNPDGNVGLRVLNYLEGYLNRFN